VPKGKALVAGIGLDTTPAQIVRGLLDGIAFSCAEVVQALNGRVAGSIGAIKADGGPSRNAWLMQRQADLCGMPVIVSDESDMTALGAALLAAIGAGQMTAEDVDRLERATRTYEPAASSDQSQSEWQRWNKAVAFVRELAER
jgi:glycerol kinase